MPIRSVDDFAEIARERELAEVESSTERFDRLAFAERALRLVRPPHTTVALCPGPSGARARVKVEAGRAWGKGAGTDRDGAPIERWAIVSVPPTASKRAIAAAVAGLAGAHEPYVLDVLFDQVDEIER
jgi:hypothetical protein